MNKVNIEKIKQNKKYANKKNNIINYNILNNSIYILYKYIIYIIFILTISKSLSKEYLSEINITIEGKGDQQILSNEYEDKAPIEVLVNGFKRQINNDYIIYGLINQTNIITIRWNESLTKSKYMFSGLENIIEINFLNFDSSHIINMNYMFSGCTSLKSIEFRNFNTSKVGHMQSLFLNCVSLTSLNLSNFDTSSVYNMWSMFNNCTSLISLNLKNFNTSKVTNMKCMFRNCISLISVDLSSFDTSSIFETNLMFNNCKSLIFLDLSSFKKYPPYENYRKDMFVGCNKNLIYCINNQSIPSITSDLSYFNTAHDCSNICFNKSKKLIIEKNICILNCFEDDTYKFEFNGICYKECPNGTYNSSNYLCKKKIETINSDINEISNETISSDINEITQEINSIYYSDNISQYLYSDLFYSNNFSQIVSYELTQNYFNETTNNLYSSEINEYNMTITSSSLNFSFDISKL